MISHSIGQIFWVGGDELIDIWVFCGSSPANIDGWQSVLSDQENPISNISRGDIYGAAFTVIAVTAGIYQAKEDA